MMKQAAVIFCILTFFAGKAQTVVENDLFIARFFERHERGLTTGQALGLSALMDLADNDLLDLLLARKEPEAGINTKEVREVLAMLRS